MVKIVVYTLNITYCPRIFEALAFIARGRRPRAIKLGLQKSKGNKYFNPFQHRGNTYIYVALHALNLLRAKTYLLSYESYLILTEIDDAIHADNTCRQ